MKSILRTNLYQIFILIKSSLCTIMFQTLILKESSLYAYLIQSLIFKNIKASSKVAPTIDMISKESWYQLI